MKPFLALLLALALSCQRPPAQETPNEAYQALSKAALRGDYRAAYQRLSASARAVLEARAKQASSLSGGAVRDDAAALFFDSPSRPPLPTEVRVVRREGNTAVLEVKGPKQTAEVQMVLEEGRWRWNLTRL